MRRIKRVLSKLSLVFFGILITMKNIKELYENHDEMPYIASKYEDELSKKPIAKRQMIRTEEGLLPGHIIMLWRINFGTYTNKSTHHKYFYTTYGIDAQKELDWLIDQGYVIVDTAFGSIKHLSAPQIKDFLKFKGVSGLSKMKRADLDKALANNYTEEELGQLFDLRGYSLSSKGKDSLENHPEIIDKHPQKKF